MRLNYHNMHERTMMMAIYNVLFCPYTQVADGDHNCNIKDVKEGEGNGLIELDLQRSKAMSHDNTHPVT